MHDGDEGGGLGVDPSSTSSRTPLLSDPAPESRRDAQAESSSSVVVAIKKKSKKSRSRKAVAFNETNPSPGPSASSVSTSLPMPLATNIQSSKGCLGFPLCDPASAWHRYFVLIFMCFLGFGSYFCYDAPGALQQHITEDMGQTVEGFSMLYSLYSWPNVILCFFGGFLIDRTFGIRLGAIIFSLFIVAGQVLVALGPLFNWYALMEIGRFIFGIGGESLAVAQNTYAVSWFKSAEINMVFGLQLSFARVGSSVNFFVMPPLYNATRDWLEGEARWGSAGHTVLGVVMIVATLTCVFSLLCAFILAFFDARREYYLKRHAAAVEQESGEPQPPPPEVVRITDVKDFNASFWLLTLICVTYYVAIFPFIGLAQTYFENKYRFSEQEANSVDSIVYIVSAVASPILGILVDKTGRNITWVFVAVVITLFSHYTLAFTYLNPWFPMVSMGIGYSVLACALWPMVAMVIPERQLGTAYGVMQAVQNLGLAVVPLIAGAINDSGGFILTEVFFLVCMCLAILSVLGLALNDLFRSDGYLNMGIKERRIYEAERDRQPLLDHLEPQTPAPVTNGNDRVRISGGNDLRNKIDS